MSRPYNVNPSTSSPTKPGTTAPVQFSLTSDSDDDQGFLPMSTAGAPSSSSRGRQPAGGMDKYASVPGRSPSPVQQLQPGAPYASGSQSSQQAASPSTSPSSAQASPWNAGTLDEPVWATVRRDLVNIWHKVQVVMFPKGRKDLLRDYDLWGPLLLCLALSINLSLMAPESQKGAVFTGVFVIVWAGAAVITLNSTLLGGKISFFQSVCVLGYCIFPLVVASLFCAFMPFIVLRAIVVIAAFGWSTLASVGFLSDSGLERRKLLAIYPIFLFYFLLSWIILIS